ncbi:MAG: substrate-binding domain-containing protein [Nocardiopsaceae bacterium]|nr:substrate-binding domain-containing protein [Nocardiopsaceae bacterium]
MSDPRSRQASIRDVARLAGVSHQTVSRVLNGHPSVREDTRTRVLGAMGELRFRPSRAARMLSTRRSEMIGVLAAAVGSHYGPASSVSAVEDAARERGFYATVAHLGSVSPDAITAAVEDLLGQDVEGIAIVAPRTAVLSHLASLPLTVPIVAAQGEQRDAGGIPVVSVDQEAGVRMLMRHLLSQGHRRILHLAGPPDWNDAQSRHRAYEAELSAAGLAVPPAVFGDWTSESGYRVGRELLARAEIPGFTAVFSSNDQMALGLIHALREAGLDVPGDVSVAGFDDIPESAHFWPPLTTVRQDFAALGRRCVAMLVDAIDALAASSPAPSRVPPAPSRVASAAAPPAMPEMPASPTMPAPPGTSDSSTSPALPGTSASHRPGRIPPTATALSEAPSAAMMPLSEAPPAAVAPRLIIRDSVAPPP